MSEKANIVTLKVHVRNREGLKLVFLRTMLLDREEKGLQPISIAFNHCVTFLIKLLCVNLEKKLNS